MKKFELLYIIPAQYTDAEIKSIEVKVAGLIEAAAGSILEQRNLGKIKLAYPIKRVQYGTYILVYFEAEAAAIKELNRKIGLTDEVLRHTLLNMPANALSKVYELTSYVPPLVDEKPQTRESSAPVRRPQMHLPPPAPAKKEESSLTIEELDKKLDEILDDADMAKKA